MFFKNKKPLRLRAGVIWEQGLRGSVPWEGIPLARGMHGLSKGRVAEIKLTKNHRESRGFGEANQRGPLSLRTQCARFPRHTARVHFSISRLKHSLRRDATHGREQPLDVERLVQKLVRSVCETGFLHRYVCG
ncbi:MAG: hypothetical protein QOJ02_1582 [Acidobacteriota bacterium]|nr:hypothetical protein [Acidobacteriota bacterium]